MQRINKYSTRSEIRRRLPVHCNPFSDDLPPLIRNYNFMDNQTKLRIGGLLVLTTAVLSLIIVLIVDSWPLAILLAVIIVAAAAGGFVWTSRRQQRQFLERLKKFDIDPEKGRINEANLRRMYHSGGQHQKDAITLVCLSQKCSADEAHAMFKKRPTRQEMNQMAAQQARGQKRPHR